MKSGYLKIIVKFLLINLYVQVFWSGILILKHYLKVLNIFYEKQIDLDSLNDHTKCTTMVWSCIYIQTCVNDLLWTTTTCQQRPL